MTGRDLISASARKIGALASGETMSSDDAADGLSELNRMIDSWSTEGLTIYAITQESPITLVGGQRTYTLGAGGDITTRPISIEKAFIRDGNTDYPIVIRNLDEYARIMDKSIQSVYPNELYDDGGYPQRTITLFPVPSAGKSLILFTKRPLSTIATLDTVVSFPPGYEEALVYGLAVRLAPEYGKAVSDVVAAVAVDSKANIQRANHRSLYLRPDDVGAGARSGWSYSDFNSGGYTR